MSHIDTLDSSGSFAPSGLSRRANSAVPSGSTDRLSVGSDVGRPRARSGSTSLRGLSNRELLSRVKDLVSRERAVTLEILVHLIEVERRRLHLGLGYASMFDYCTRHLGYSSSAASRRIQSARCVRDYPEVYGLLEKNEVNLVTISLVASILTESNAKDVIGKIRGKSQREVEAIVAGYRPPVSMRDRATPVCVAAAARSALQPSLTRGEHTPTAGSEKRPNSTADGGAVGQSQTPTMIQAQSQASTQRSYDIPTPAVPVLERKFQIQFLASERFMKKFERAKALLSNRSGTLSYEAVLEAALDELLKDHDPEKRQQRREDRKEKAEARTISAERVEKRTSRPQGNGETSRHVPAAMRDAVFARDKGRCTFIGSNGERCASTRHLQIDHVIPYARGGTNVLGNLRLLCERHNKKEAERILGPNVTGRFRARK